MTDLFSKDYYVSTLQDILNHTDNTNLDDWVGCAYHDIAKLFCELNKAAYEDRLCEVIDSRGTIDFEIRLIQIMHAIYIDQDLDIILIAMNEAISYKY